MSQAQTLASSSAASLHASATTFDCSWAAGGSHAVWVHVSGEVDLTTSAYLQQKLREAQAHARLLVLDLRAVSFMDSTGIHVILATAAAAHAAGGRLTLIRGPAQVDRILTLTGVDRQLQIIDLDAAHSIDPDADE